MGGQPGQSMTRSGELLTWYLVRIDIQTTFVYLELRVRTWVTVFTSEDTRELLVTV